MKTTSFFLILVTLNIVFISCSKDERISGANENFINGNWKVVAIESDSSKIDFTQNDIITVSFTDNNFHGNSTGLCGNYFSGNYSLRENKIGFSNLSSTEAVCPNSLYWSTFQAFKTADNYKLTDTLYLYNNLEKIKIYLIKQ